MTKPDPFQDEASRGAARAHARAVRQAVTPSAKLLASEQLAVAQNLWRILDEAERRDVRKARVLNAAGQGAEGDSTKRLERFAINPALDPAVREARAGRLTKTASKYLAIAEAAGQLAAADKDEFVAQLFAGTRFATPDDVAPAVEDVCSELAALIREASHSVARRLGLQALFRRCDDLHALFHGGWVRQNRGDSWSRLWRHFTDGREVRGLLCADTCHGNDWAMPYPSVLVGWSDVAAELPFLVTSPADPDAKAEVKGCLKLEVRLALLPLGPGGAVEPVFVTSPWTTVAPSEIGLETVGGPDGRWSRRGLPAPLDGEGWTPRCPDEDWKPAFAPFAGAEPALWYRDDFSAGWPVRIDLVSPASCRRLLALSRSDSARTGFENVTVLDDLDPAIDAMGDEERREHWRARHDWTVDEAEALLWRTEPRSLGETLENALLYESDEAKRFDAVLARAAGRYAEALTTAFRGFDDLREKRKAELRAAWDTAGPRPPADPAAA